MFPKSKDKNQKLHKWMDKGFDLSFNGNNTLRSTGRHKLPPIEQKEFSKKKRNNHENTIGFMMPYLEETKGNEFSFEQTMRIKTDEKLIESDHNTGE